METILDTLVTDRTQEDVERVRELAAKYPDWTAADQAEWFSGMKGAYNASDMNRVGQAAAYVKQQLEEIGFAVPGYVALKTDWAGGTSLYPDTPTAEQARTYLGTIRAIKIAVNALTPLPTSMDNLTVEDANNIERILLDAQERAEDIMRGWVYSGEFEAGEL